MERMHSCTVDSTQRTKALSDDAVPCGLISAIKVFLDIRCDVLLNLVSFQSLHAREIYRQHCLSLHAQACMMYAHTCVAQLMASCRMSSRMSTDLTVTLIDVMLGAQDIVAGFMMCTPWHCVPVVLSARFWGCR